MPELGPWQAIWPVRRCRCRPKGTAELRQPFGPSPSTWSRNVIARSEFSCFAEIAPDSVLSCLPRAGCPPLGTWGWTAWATTNRPAYRTGFPRAAGPRARPRQTGTPPQQTRTGPSPRPARRQIQVRQVARAVWPGVACVHARGAPCRVRPATDMRSRACGRSLACGPSPAPPVSARTACSVSVPEAGTGIAEK